jgi:Flp pilus assembly protein TadG
MMPPRHKVGLREDRRGAVYVEFLVAFLPMLTLFLSIVQLADLYAAKLVVRHAAYRAARAGAVVFPDDPANYEDGASKMDDVRMAGLIVMHAKGTIIDGDVEVTSGTEYEPGQPVNVKVTATYRCVFPVANRLVCTPFKFLPFRQIEAEATMPAHAARYPYTEGS